MLGVTPQLTYIEAGSKLMNLESEEFPEKKEAVLMLGEDGFSVCF